MTWTYRPESLTETFEKAGFDVDRDDEDRIGGGGSLTARRERAGRTILVAVDAAGRLRITVTERRGETAGAARLGGLDLREIEETIRTRTLTGRLAGAADLDGVLTDLDRPVPDHGAGSRPPARAAERAESSDGPW
jgi:hypothetical protein